MTDKTLCELCGEPMPEGEEMFNYHGRSGPCPKESLPKPETDKTLIEDIHKFLSTGNAAKAIEVDRSARELLQDALPILESTQAKLAASCDWHEDDDGIWNSGCGRVWQFTDGGPEENKYDFCHGCGKSVSIILVEDYDEAQSLLDKEET